MFRRIIEDSSVHVSSLTALCLLLFFPFLGARDFWDIETHFAEVIRVMALDGNYLLPTMNGERWTENPPFYFWIAVFFSWLAGQTNEWTIRLPSALSATELILAYYIFARNKFGPQPAFISTVVLATSVLTVHVERHVPINMTFYLFVILALFLLMEIVVFDSERRIHAYGAWLCIALACLTNGVAGLLIPMLVVCPYLILSGRWRQAHKLRLVAGAILLVAVLGAWAGAVAWTFPGTWWELVFKELALLHYSGHGSADHQFFFRFPLAFTPWAFLLIPAIIALWPQRARLRDNAILFLALWFLMTLLFCEFLPGYHSHYVFLTFFPMALALGVYLNQLISKDPAEPEWIWTHRFDLLVSVVLLVAGFSAPVVMHYQWPFLMTPAIVCTVTALFFAILVYFSSRRRNAYALICSFAVFPIVLNLLLQGLLFPLLNGLNGRPVAVKIGALIHSRPEARLAITADTHLNFFNYYSGITRFETLNGSEQVARFLSEPAYRYILARPKALEEIKRTWPGDLSVELAGHTTRGTWLLVSPCVGACNSLPPSAGR